MTISKLPSSTFPGRHAARLHGCRLRDAPFPYVVPVCRKCADNALFAYWLSPCEKDEAVILMLYCSGCESTGQVRLGWKPGRPVAPERFPSTWHSPRLEKGVLWATCSCSEGQGAPVLYVTHELMPDMLLVRGRFEACGHQIDLRVIRWRDVRVEGHGHGEFSGPPPRVAWLPSAMLG
jgi:hypothetical protein